MMSKALVSGLLLAALAFPATAGVRNVTDPDAPRSLPADGTVDVRWTDPAQFTDIRYSGNRFEAARGNWVMQLAEHLQERALKELEQIVGRLERGDVELEESIEIYERGEALREHCGTRLRQAEAKVEKLKMSGDGRPIGSEPLDSER